MSSEVSIKRLITSAKDFFLSDLVSILWQPKSLDYWNSKVFVVGNLWYIETISTPKISTSTLQNSKYSCFIRI
jgi:hypothetical protein